jgi:endonuclease/exonuclease/phosphatase family metal-dependent hydrolase
MAPRSQKPYSLLGRLIRFALLALLAPATGLEIGTVHAFAPARPAVNPSQATPLVPPAPALPSGARSFLLRVLTYNVKGVFTAGDSARFSDIGRLLAERRKNGDAPHVVAIQEAFGDRTLPVAQLSGYPYRHFGPPAGAGKISSGLIFMSEFPIERSATHLYTQCTSWDCFANKGAQYIRVSIPGAPSPIEVFNTHMNSDPDTDFWTPIEEAQDMRFSQAQELRDFASDVRAGHFPVIFLGDFNFDRQGYDYESFVGFLMVRDAMDQCAQSPASCQGAAAAGAFHRTAIDHHFVDDGRSPRVSVTPVSFARRFAEPYQGRMLSDHDGVEITYRVTW